VVIAKLKELDNDLLQHIYLEETVLFPKVLKMEKELLAQQVSKSEKK
jgi:regulator of cell morphogenesis and NO signaling